MCGPNIKKTQLIRPGGIVGTRLFHWVARIDQIDKVDALNRAPFGDVQTGNDAGFEHCGCPPRGRDASSTRQEWRARVGANGPRIAATHNETMP